LPTFVRHCHDGIAIVPPNEQTTSPEIAAPAWLSHTPPISRYRKCLLEAILSRPKSLDASRARNQMEGRAAVASAGTGHTATTERGPPDHPKTCAQNAHKFRHKELIRPKGKPAILRAGRNAGFSVQKHIVSPRAKHISPGCRPGSIIATRNLGAATVAHCPIRTFTSKSRKPSRSFQRAATSIGVPLWSMRVWPSSVTAIFNCSNSTRGRSPGYAR